MPTIPTSSRSLRSNARSTSVTPTDDLATEKRLLATALDDVRVMVDILTSYHQATDSDPTQVYKVGLGSVRLLYAVGDLLLGWLLLEQADVAKQALSDDATRDAFYRGKIVVASFFAKNVLPELTAVRSVLSSLDVDIMDFDDASF
jgi:hypothetical protein